MPVHPHKGAQMRMDWGKNAGCPSRGSNEDGLRKNAGRSSKRADSEDGMEKNAGSSSKERILRMEWKKHRTVLKKEL